MRGKRWKIGIPDMSLRVARRRRLRGPCGFTTQWRWGLCVLLLVTCSPRWTDAQRITGPGNSWSPGFSLSQMGRDHGDEAHARTQTCSLKAGLPQSHSGLSYFGIWDVKANRAGVFSAPQASVTLGKLVQEVDGESGGRTGLAWVIRDDLTGIRIPWEPQSEVRVLAGDLIVLPSHQGGISAGPQGHAGFAGGASGTVAANSADYDRVQVAFVGIESRRPIIAALPQGHATIANVLDQLHQNPELAKTVKVIRTDSQRGPVKRGDSHVPLVDGDVLVFDRSQLDERGLAAAQANPAPAIQDSRQLHLARAAANDVRPPAAGEWSSRPPPTSVDFRPSNVAPHFPGSGAHARALREPSDNSDAIGAVNRAKRQAVVDAELSGAAPLVEESTAEVALLHQVERAAPPPPAEAATEDAADLRFGESLPAAITADHYSSTEPPHFSTMTGVAATPIEPVSAAVESAGDGSLESLSTLTIAFGVLALAGLCFMVSVAWTRIDRTAQPLQQSPLSRGTGGDAAGTERKPLDQLIGNSVPMIEEQAPLPDRMDYFGPELGRQRMIIDPPHEMAGPHFALAPAGTKAERSSRKPVMTAAAAHQLSLHSGNAHTEARLVRAADQIRQRGRRRRRPAHTEPMATKPSETKSKETKPIEAMTIQTEPMMAVSDEPEALLPCVGLLERVLIAMERERRS